MSRNSNKKSNSSSSGPVAAGAGPSSSLDQRVLESNTLIKIPSGSCAPTFQGMYTLIEGSSYTQATADLEFDDNAVDANATLCYTHVHSDNNNYTTRIVKIDNGEAMTAAELQAAYQMAGDAKERGVDVIGKFLMGMKGASLSQCKDITIVTRKNGSITCLHTDVDTQLARNSFEPTEFIANATRDHVLKYIHPIDIDRFLSFPTAGTLIQLKNFLPEAVSSAEATTTNLTNAISDAYPHMNSIKFYIQNDCKGPTEISRTDVFYHDKPAAVKFDCNVLLQIYKPKTPGGPHRVIERVMQTREYYGGVAHAGHDYEHFPAVKGQAYHKGIVLVSPEEVERIKPNLLGTIDGRMIEVTDETYQAEQHSMPDVNQKGFHLVRNNRKVSAALTLGYDIHSDKESHAHRPRQRMEVRFPASLDKQVGSTWNKTMRDGPLAQTVLGDALYRIFRQRAFAWTKQTLLDVAERTRPSDTDSDVSSIENTDTEDSPQPSVPNAFLNVILPASPVVNHCPDTLLGEESPVSTDDESITSVSVPTTEEEVPVTLPSPAPRLFERNTAVEWETHLTGFDLGEREIALLVAVRAYLSGTN